MANVKISQLPAVSSVLTTDVVATVASSATSQITIQNLANSLPNVPSASFASTASFVNRLNQNLVVSGSLLMSGSIIPNVGNGSYTSSFDLGSFNAAWRDLYIANGTIYFTDPANNQKSTLSVTSGSLVSSGSGQINSGSIIHKTAVGTLTVRTDQLSGADSVTGSFRFLPEGYQAYNLYNNFNYNGESIIYLYQLCRSSGSAVAKNPITTSPIRIVNRSGYSPIVLKPYVDDSSVGFKTSQGSFESSSFYLSTGSYVDLYVETPTATGFASLSWVITDSGSINAASTSSISAQTASYINNLNQNVVITGSLLMSGSIIPNVGDGSYTSSFDLGSPTNAWRDLYIANGTIYFTDPANNQKATLSVTSGSLISSGSGQKNSGSTLIHKTAVGTLSGDTRNFYDPTGEFGNRKQLPEGYQNYYLYVGHQSSNISVVQLYSIRQGTGPANKTPKNSITTSPIRIHHMGGWPTMTLKPASEDSSSISITYGPEATATASFTIISGSYIDLLVRTPDATITNVLNWVIISTGSLYGW